MTFTQLSRMVGTVCILVVPLANQQCDDIISSSSRVINCMTFTAHITETAIGINGNAN